MECQKTLRTLFASSVKHTARKSISQQRLNLQLVHDNVVFLWIENEKHIALFQASDVQAINNEETTEDGKLFLEVLRYSYLYSYTHPRLELFCKKDFARLEYSFYKNGAATSEADV